MELLKTTINYLLEIKLKIAEAREEYEEAKKIKNELEKL